MNPEWFPSEVFHKIHEFEKTSLVVVQASKKVLHYSQVLLYQARKT